MRLLPFSRFIVHEHSMIPAYKPGDHVLTFNWSLPRVGDVVVFMQQGKSFIKRIEKVENGEVFISGDNKKESAKFSPIDQKDIIGKVIFRY
ncbi:hypothetical protein A2165_03605 [Candidatus Curtissbacteria bacterium RBG_13_40_7]|uniref:Peptidase S24/S26A/S26B/S26C domain-containing protein n=1 Tax=Candidatus Curtissbacteria bacterium RBG_13_40_7 TaxID=1797706 RepID=A0A1F5FX83_9BACT|nr:MAG: hypothetical protein A2165_03605 [Candidatus Curtissbacteria bacterium RBG_13_40_7]